MTDRSRFRALVDDLRSRIDGLPIGAEVPSERTLAADSGVSRMAARRALDELAREGRRARGSVGVLPSLVRP